MREVCAAQGTRGLRTTCWRMERLGGGEREGVEAPCPQLEAPLLPRIVVFPPIPRPRSQSVLHAVGLVVFRGGYQGGFVAR